MKTWTLNYYDVTEAESEWLVGTDDPYSHKERRSYEARGESGFHAVWLTNEVIAAVAGGCGGEKMWGQRAESTTRLWGKRSK